MRGNHRFGFLLVIVCIIVMGCNFTAQTTPQATQVVTETDAPPEVELSPTALIPTSTTASPLPTSTQPVAETIPPSATTLPEATATSGPVCTVLQDLNLRTGPGTAYRPPIRALPAQTSVIPLGYNPTGIPGGPWVQVEDQANDLIGWVSAGDQYVSCNIDLTSLPSVAVAPPAPPPPPNTDNSTPDGTFPESFVWEADFDSQYFVRFLVHDTINGETKDGEGITEVNFQVLDESGNLVYERTERQAGFCIFGGGEPNCNPWILEDFVYMWEEGGEPVKEGDYKLLIVVIAESGNQGNWNYDVSVNLPN